MSKRITVRVTLWDFDRVEDALLVETQTSSAITRVPPLIVAHDSLTPLEMYSLVQSQIGDPGMLILRDIINEMEATRKAREEFNKTPEIQSLETPRYTAVIVEYVNAEGNKCEVYVKNMEEVGESESELETTHLKADGILDEDGAIAIGNLFLHGDQSRDDYPLIPPNEETT